MNRLLLTVLMAGLLCGCKSRPYPTPTPTPHTKTPTPESPGASVPDGQNACSELHQGTPPRLPPQASGTEICRPGLQVMLNPATRLAWYSAEYLTPQRMSGKLRRREEFLPDPLLPAALQVDPVSYTRSGFDRGHLAPAADFKNDPAGMAASFYTSNIAPQNRTLNREAWAALESAARDCARREGGVYVLTGVTGASPSRRGRPATPQAFWKLISREGHYRAFVYPNRALSKGHPMHKQETSLLALEALTGLRFSGLSDQRLCSGSFGRSRP